MRDWQRRARTTEPSRALVDRAKQRARRKDVPYGLRRQDLVIPDHCPVLGIPLVVGGSRSDASPSLDRIDPGGGYVPGNVRVISDRANRLKGDRSLAGIQALALEGPRARRAEHAAVADYMEREKLLVEVKRRAALPIPNNPWPKIADFLEAKFQRYDPGRVKRFAK
ncbi:MAG: hypothetical protein KF910_08670 [Brevundimonas sp.]|uniref:hypothetical protein n=1 Tax=Brevundimonas sp. TaxID=1871086 RepID=UPI0025C51892|nr:hypothetical protein [Brevundimonas sp.]MBX3477667.1 hypothetical protein [Brevundimonas sp.]